jgi:Zn-dependent protease with chaperone function
MARVRTEMTTEPERLSPGVEEVGEEPVWPVRSSAPPWPPLTLLLAISFLPLASLVVIAIGNDRFGAESAAQLGLVEVWRSLALAAFAAGSALVLVVPIAARAARGRPRLTLKLLTSGIPIGVLLVGAVVLAHAVLAYAVTLAVEHVTLGSAIPATATVLLIGGAASAVYVVTSGLGALREVEVPAMATTLHAATAPGLHSLVADLAGRVGVSRPEGLLLGLTMDFWAAQGSFRSIDDVATGRVVHVSLPQLALLSEPDVEAIVAHELAHLRNRDTEAAARLAPAFERLSTATEALDRESQGIGRLAAMPGLLWLEFATLSAMSVVAETRRIEELAADRVAADVVGVDRVAYALVSSSALWPLDDAWSAEVARAVEGDAGVDPLGSFVAGARKVLATVKTEDILEISIETTGPDHVTLPERLHALGVSPPDYAPAEHMALDRLVGPAAMVEVSRLLEALKPVDRRQDAETINPPRLTPGIVGWVLIGLIGVPYFLQRLATAGNNFGNVLQIAIVAGGLWLLFPLVYPWLQREVVLDRGGMRIRPWLWRWLDREARRLAWVRLSWSDSTTLTVRWERILTLSDGSRSVHLWAEIWPRRELAKLVDALRDRGAAVRFTAHMTEEDDERRAVVWLYGDRFLVPQIRRTHDGHLVETRPVKTIPVDPAGLQGVLVDRLHGPIEALGKKLRGLADVEHLATVAEIDEDTFMRDARKLTVGGGRHGWTIRVEGLPGLWAAERRKTDEADLTVAIFGVLDLWPADEDDDAPAADGEIGAAE